ncbi:MAG TPA: NAD(P)(+) transhydrogenase (Re/Si-specific) subunit beta [Phycisphaeraceae bacterium]
MHTLELVNGATENLVSLLYLSAAVLFIVGLKMLSSVRSAPRGNLISAVGMLIASVATLLLVNRGAEPGQSYLISFIWIGVAVAVGTVIGLLLALRVRMTAMPQMVALLNGFGGAASLLVACADYTRKQGMLSGWTFYNDQSYLLVGMSWDSLLATGLTILIGGVTFTGSLVAFGKLQGLKITPGEPIQFPGQKVAIALLLLAGLALSALLIAWPLAQWIILVASILSLVLGVLLVIGIGGADMPVVISLLNSYSGLAAAMAGFILRNEALIITGALVGASGIILTNLMCKAMNRSLMNVLFGGVGALAPAGDASAGPAGQVRQFSPEDAAVVLEAARRVMIVPGYGMAVAQAQHAVKELEDELEQRGVSVRYAIHPVAGRMPGHMNVLLAEAGVPYEQLLDLDQSNAELEQTDVALVIGANDVTNPAARHDRSSPLYGMPILNVDQARTVFVIKRSMNPGFAGVENELYYRENCGMIFGDAKRVVTELVAAMENI